MYPGEGAEFRMNRALYNQATNNTLYNIKGTEDRVHSGKPIKTPASLKETKTRCVPFTERTKPRYHWREITRSNETKQLWGLTAIHIMTRDSPNWFWCDFEHADFERNAEQYSHDSKIHRHRTS